jgi:3-oxoadipate enol-lactonase
MESDFDLEVSAGRLHARAYGPDDGRLLLCIPGLTANLVSFDPIALEAASAGLHVVSLDLRGRGMSQTTGAGTYGMVNHARDVLEAADRLGASTFRVVGWSMGAFVAMQAAALASERLERVALIDGVGPVERGAAEIVKVGVQRLGGVYPSVAAYIALARALGVIEPWSDIWERYFRYDLQPVEGGVRPATSRDAALEDIADIEASDPVSLWAALTMPVLLVRALSPLTPSQGFVVSESDRDRFLSQLPHARLIEVNANHYGVGVDPTTAQAIAGFMAE